MGTGRWLLAVGTFVLGVVVGVVLAAPGDAPVAAVEGDAPAGRGGFEITYPEVSGEARDLQSAVRRSGVLEEAAEQLTARLAMPVDIAVEVRSCEDGTGYLPDDRRVELCVEDLAQSRADLRAAGDEDVDATVEGILRETFLHEAAHALIDVLDLPYTGREEDVEALLSAAYHYEVLAAAYEQDATDEHASDPQRAVNHLCWVHGSDPEEWADLVDGEPLTKDRAERCPEEWADLDRGWRSLLHDAGALRP